MRKISGDLLKHHAEKPNSLLHAQSIRRRLNSYNFGATDFDYTTGSKHHRSSIVWAIAEFFVWTKESDSKRTR